MFFFFFDVCILKCDCAQGATILQVFNLTRQYEIGHCLFGAVRYEAVEDIPKFYDERIACLSSKMEDQSGSYKSVFFLIIFQTFIFH